MNYHGGGRGVEGGVLNGHANVKMGQKETSRQHV